jgi:hypothetical protein
MAHTSVCSCCGEDVHPEEQSYHPDLLSCGRCASGKCRKCRSWVRVRKRLQDPTFNMGVREGNAWLAVGVAAPCSASRRCELTSRSARSVQPWRTSQPDHPKPSADVRPAAHAVRLALWRQAQGKPDWQAFHDLQKATAGWVSVPLISSKERMDANSGINAPSCRRFFLKSSSRDRRRPTEAVSPLTAHNRKEVKNSTWFRMISVDGL